MLNDRDETLISFVVACLNIISLLKFLSCDSKKKFESFCFAEVYISLNTPLSTVDCRNNCVCSVKSDFIRKIKITIFINQTGFAVI